MYLPNFLNNTIVGVKDDNWVFIYYDEDKNSIIWVVWVLNYMIYNYHYNWNLIGMSENEPKRLKRLDKFKLCCYEVTVINYEDWWHWIRRQEGYQKK